MDEVFGFAHSMIFLLDEARNVLAVAASRGYGESGVGAEVLVGQGVVGVVAKKKKLMRLGGIGVQRQYLSSVREGLERAGTVGPAVSVRLPGLANVQSQVAIPLLLEDRLVGVFAVESERPSAFDETDEILLGILANQAASAIHKARLYLELRSLNESLEAKVRERTEDLRRAQAKLVQSEKMASLGMLVAGIAHEMNTPLGSIRSMHDTLFKAVDRLRGVIEAKVEEGHPLRPAAAPLLEVTRNARSVIETGTDRVSAIVRRLKSFARLDEADVKEIDLHECLEDAIALLSRDLDAVKVERRYGELPRLLCHPSRLNQVFLNVILNARQALGDSGTIAIETRASDGKITVQIRDDGAGIPTEYLKRVFDPGFTTKGVGVGTGLGLSICYQIVQDHRGEIRIESELGRGTTVTIVLPVAP
jgi:signal transduction histidine kinase